MYGELCRSHEGILALSAQNVMKDLITTIRKPDGVSTEVLRGAWWGLGHICSTEFGYAAITNLEPDFVEWCIRGATVNPNFAVRATIFQVLGLVSRCYSGSRRLDALQWDCSPEGSSFAVAVPRNPTVLFSRDSDEFNVAAVFAPLSGTTTGANNVNNAMPHTLHYAQFLHSGGNETDLEVLHLIAKVSNQSIHPINK